MKVFVDIETIGTAVGSGIWEIGAVVVHPTGAVDNFQQLCRPNGMTSTATMEWIRSKPAVNARYEAALSCNVTQASALEDFAYFLMERRGGRKPDRHTEAFYSWGNFDFPLLGWHYDQMLTMTSNYDKPWHYGSECDLRSVAKFHGISDRPDTSAHEAHQDALALSDFYHRITGRFPGT